MSEAHKTVQAHNAQLTGVYGFSPTRATAPPAAPNDSDLAILLTILQKTRFTGRLTRHGHDYGFIHLDGTTLDVFIHRDICADNVTWDSLQVGDRLRFNVKESKVYPGKLCAGR